VFASHRHARALAACVSRQDHDDLTTDESFRFHNNKFDHDLYQVSLAKVCQWRLQKKLRFFRRSLKENPSNIAILPVKLSFPGRIWFIFRPSFGTQCSCASIASIVDSYWSSWKVESKICHFHFQSLIFSLLFFLRKQWLPVKTVWHASYFVRD